VGADAEPVHRSKRNELVSKAPSVHEIAGVHIADDLQPRMVFIRRVGKYEPMAQFPAEWRDEIKARELTTPK
jgi:hypothetical protein